MRSRHLSTHRINTAYALHSPQTDELCKLLRTICSRGLWKIGACYEDLLDGRPRDAAHYNPEYFDRDGAMCVAYGITGKAHSAALETAGIKLLKDDLRVGVNYKSSDDVPHDSYSSARPGALYIVPVKPRYTTQQQFWDEHKSYYKLTHGGAGLMEQRRGLGLSAHTAHTTSTEDGRKHDGGKQPKKHVCMNDDDFVSGLIHSGIPLAQLDSAFAGKSCGRLNKLLAISSGRCLRSLVSSHFSLVASKSEMTSTSASSLPSSVLASLDRRPARLQRFLLMRQSPALSWSSTLMTTWQRLRERCIPLPHRSLKE